MGRHWLTWRVVLAAVVAAAVAALVFGVRARAADSDPADYVSMTPCRVLDTRPQFQVGPIDTPLGPNASIVIEGHGTSGECTIPDTATGLMLNVTTESATLPTYITVWPNGEDQPNASMLNPHPGQPPTPNAVATGISVDGRFNVYNRFGEVDLIVDILGYYTADAGGGATDADYEVLKQNYLSLEADYDDLEARVKQLESLLEGVTREGSELTFSEMNVNIVNGQGATNTSDGLGNLVIGYNADLQGDPNDRSGSHMLVVGDEHSYSSYGGVVVGRANTVTGPWSAVTGGTANTASGDFSAVSGGSQSEASGPRSSVNGGRGHIASGAGASVSGGDANQATGDYASASGGSNNFVSGSHASISGGSSNVSSGSNTSVSGGNSGQATGDYASVTGGISNRASAPFASVSGGKSNVANGQLSSILGGEKNTFVVDLNGNPGGGSISGGDDLACSPALTRVCGEGFITVPD